MNYIPSYKDHDCTEEEFDASKPKKSNGLTFNLSEETLLFLLRCAVDSADFNEYEKGSYDSAKEIRKKIRRIIFAINQQLGFEKYTYDSEYGLEEVKRKD